MCIDAKWRFDTWLCMLFLLAAIGSATPVGAANFEVEGSLIAIYSQGGTNSAQKTTYVVSVDGARWQIKTIFGEDYYMLHGCDGTNIYSVLHMPGGPDGQAAPATITAGVCPVDAEYYTTLPWLAFASDRYLEQNTDSLPASDSGLRYHPGQADHRTHQQPAENGTHPGKEAGIQNHPASQSACRVSGWGVFHNFHHQF